MQVSLNYVSVTPHLIDPAPYPGKLKRISPNHKARVEKGMLKSVSYCINHGGQDPLSQCKTDRVFRESINKNRGGIC